MESHERLHALDAVRGFALLAGVVLHSAMSFLPGFQVTGIPIVDNSPSLLLSIVFYVIHMFRMTLFFVVAGFFGRLLLERDGGRRFVRNRMFRILLPLVVFWVVVFPPIVVAVIWGAHKTYGDRIPPKIGMSEPNEWLAFPLTHLWFLYVLVWLYAAAVISRWLLDRVFDRDGRRRATIDRWLRSLLRGPGATVVLAAPLALNLSLLSDWQPWFGIPTPDHSLIPNLSATIAFTTAFAFGWLLERQRDLIRIWETRWKIHLLIAIATTIACLSIVGVSPRYSPFADPWQRATYAACYCLGVWSWTFAIFGFALRYGSDHSPLRRYLADASYWVYLMHLPLVFLLQVAVQDVTCHWAIKFPFVLGSALLLLLVSYHGMVRSTWIGLWLSGRRYPGKA